MINATSVRGLPLALRGVPWPNCRRRVVAVAFWVVLPVLCGLVIIFGSDKLSVHLNNVPPGVRGSYLVTSHSCSDEVCTTGGTFTSADARIVEQDLLGVYNWQNGETHRVVYDSTSVDVIPLPAHWDPTATFVGIVGALGFLGSWFWCLAAAIRRRAGTG